MDRIPCPVSIRRVCSLIAVGAIVWGGAPSSELAFAQLRTGRSGAREFYPSTHPVASHPRIVAEEKGPEGRYGSGIQKATSMKPARQKTLPEETTADEQVIQAGCRSCGDTSVHVHRDPPSEIILEGDERNLALPQHHGATYGACGDCGSVEGDCGCDGIPHINIRLAFPFARAFERFSVRMEAATFWRDNAAVPALVRTNDEGVPGSIDLFGGTVAMDEATQGYRGEVAWNFGDDDCTSVQVRFFDAGAQSLTFDSNGSITPAIVRPFAAVPGLTPSSIAVRLPGTSNGEVLAHATSDLFGGDLLLRQIAYRSRYSKLDLLVGYQTASLTDSILVNSITNTPPAPGQLSVLDLRDRFDTSNRFHAGVIGLSGIAYAPRWSVASTVKLGMGNMERYVGIDGSQNITVGLVPNKIPQGLHARSTNKGTYQFDTFIVSPEVNLTLGYRLTRHLEATVGYDYLLLPKVARAADQFDADLASNLAPTGDPRPTFVFRESDLGVHSLSYGLQYRY